MGRVADNRGIPRQNCMISYTEATDASLGNLWLLVVSDIDGDSAWCLVVDLPQRKHYAGIRSRGIVVELDLGSARRLCNISYAGQEPPRACPVTVYR